MVMFIAGCISSRISEFHQSTLWLGLPRFRAGLPLGSIPQLLRTLGIHPRRMYYHGHPQRHHQPVRLWLLHAWSNQRSTILRDLHCGSARHWLGRIHWTIVQVHVRLCQIESQAKNHSEESYRTTQRYVGLEIFGDLLQVGTPMWFYYRPNEPKTLGAFLLYPYWLILPIFIVYVRRIHRIHCALQE